MPFIDSAELAGIVGEAHSTVHRALADLLADGIAGRVNHGTVHLLSSHRYYLTANGVREAAGVLGFDTPSDFVRAYPMSREWLTLLTRRLDAVASIYRLAATMSLGIDGRCFFTFCACSQVSSSTSWGIEISIQVSLGWS